MLRAFRDRLVRRRLNRNALPTFVPQIRKNGCDPLNAAPMLPIMIARIVFPNGYSFVIFAIDRNNELWTAESWGSALKSDDITTAAAFRHTHPHRIAA